KPKIWYLLVFTAFAAAITASNIYSVEISPVTWVLMLFGVAAGSAAANTLTNYHDRDIDAIMERTKNRPIPKGEVSLNFVLVNGVIFTLLGLVLSYFLLGWLTTLIIFLGFFFDFVVYSIWLKRKTKYSILFGGIAGGLPAVAGRVLAIQKVDILSGLFLLFILTWIPVHILTLALIPKNLKSYKEAGLPMWPVVSSKEETMRVIAYSALVNAVVIFIAALILEIYWVVLILVGVCCSTLVIMVFMNLLKPTQKLTFTIFKFASAFMLLGFMLLYVGVVV
ncbi:MAG: protoheme IX farnesyltransferase, partial [Promethearchaeota archaeon]